MLFNLVSSVSKNLSATGILGILFTGVLGILLIWDARETAQTLKQRNK